MSSTLTPTLSPTIRLAEELIARRSITPVDAGCQQLIATRLRALGFDCSSQLDGPPDAPVANLWALRRGTDPAAKLIAFAGHTDVVPTGPLEQWASDPFVPTRRDGKLHGRGAVDMKTSLAAMVVATEEFVTARPQHAGSIGFLVTSDEEGAALDGSVALCRRLEAAGIRLDGCIVGEPTCVERLGDTIKNGRRGSLSGKLTINGVQGHIAYPQLARNPLHLAAPALAELVATEWDRGNHYFSPTSWQMSNIHGGTGAGNVIPSRLVVDFNFRFCTESTPAALRRRVEETLVRHGLDFDIAWTLGGEPFLTPAGVLSQALGAAIRAHTGIAAELSTSGGTSDGRFIAKICPEVVEFGPVNATIHKVDECVDLESIDVLKNIYRATLERLLE